MTYQQTLPLPANDRRTPDSQAEIEQLDQKIEERYGVKPPTPAPRKNSISKNAEIIAAFDDDQRTFLRDIRFAFKKY